MEWMGFRIPWLMTRWNVSLASFAMSTSRLACSSSRFCSASLSRIACDSSRSEACERATAT
uniref:ETR7 n=1 Tax=Arundo donax TaxID=35708 RepID=A0A0A9G4V6_ARUDO